MGTAMTKIQRIFPSAWRLSAMATIAIVAVATVGSFIDAQADAVEYVQICPVYGADFFYVPQTDICLNVVQNDAREVTSGGTWRWRVPNNPRTYSSLPQNGCQNGGTLVKFADINSSGLGVNSHARFETKNRYALNLHAQYIASVLYKGGFTIPSLTFAVANLPSCPAGNAIVNDATDCTPGDTAEGGGSLECEVSCVDGAWQYTGDQNNRIGQGNFCMFYYYNDPVTGPKYSFPLGCIDTSPQANLQATLAFAPDSPIPPPTSSQVYIVGANGDTWDVPSPSNVQGTLSVWLCLQHTSGH